MADQRRGAAALDAAHEQRPVVLRFSDTKAALHKLWVEGLPPGDSTGWPAVDHLYTVLPGQLTVVTGWPSSGKSEWVDALMVNLTVAGWRFVVFSPENQPIVFHQTKLLEKLSGKPFGVGPNERLMPDEIEQFSTAFDNTFLFVSAPDGISVRTLADMALPLLQATPGKRGLVIDPWNELEHWRPAHMNETEYVSQTLSMLRNWARFNHTHVWVVAHPQKMRRDEAGKLPVPRPDMISGSQHWWNKADCCITVHREVIEDSQDVSIYVQKMRFKHIGRIGHVILKYDRVAGRFFEPLERNLMPINKGWRGRGVNI